MKNCKTLCLRLSALLLSLLFLCGCGTPEVGKNSIISATTPDWDENTAPTVQTLPPDTVPNGSSAPKDEASFYSVEYTPNVALPEYDPNRQVYFACHNWDYDFYPNGAHNYIRFTILTKEEIAPEHIRIALPLESGYTAQVYKEEYFHEPEWQEDGNLFYGGMPYHVYLTYQGMDWAELADFWLEAERAQLDIRKEWPAGYPESEPSKELTALEQTIERYHTALNANRETYYALTAESLPDYYGYTAMIVFDLDNLTEETCETITITVNDIAYTEEIGQIRIHGEDLSDPSPVRDMEIYALGTTFNLHDPWGGGMAFGTGHHFDAKADLTLLGLRIEGMDAQIEGVKVSMFKRVSDGRNEFATDYQELVWDPATPLEIEENYNVQLELIISSPEWTQFEYGGFADIYLDYQVGQKYCSYRLPADMTRDRAAWETAAIVFDNLDIASYYTDYYIPCGETWREMIA